VLAVVKQIRYLAFVVAVVACTEAPPPEPGAVEHVVSFDYPQAALTPQLDVLVVVDSSPAIAAHRDRLVASYRRFAEVFQTIGGLPDLHLGVVTADLGGTGCGPGDDGALRHADVVTGDFLADFPTSSSARQRNYGGDLGVAITALADAGVAGCAITQPLAAMRRALERPSGFRRAHAFLAVIFISATDDASPISIDDAEAFLKSAAPDRDTSKLIVSVIGGPEAATCATPATRLTAFAQRFEHLNLFTSICDAEQQGALAILDRAYFSLLFLPCLEAPLADLDPGPGTLFDCTVSDIYADVADPAIEHEDLLAACDAAATNRPCWQFATNKFSCQGLTLEVERPFLPVAGAHMRGQCLAD
jgi:hypothetical protein